MELVLPRLLAPDLPSICYFLINLILNHFNYKYMKYTYIDIRRHCLKKIFIGQFTRLLLSLKMVAISQAPSPESNPNSLYP